MPNGREHAIIGATAACAAGLIASNGEPDYARLFVTIGAGIGGSIGGRVPDKLEPAIHSHHRDVFHSGAAAGTLIWGGSRMYASARNAMFAEAARLRAKRESLPLDHGDRVWLGIAEVTHYLAFGIVTGLAVGYLSHIAADFATPRGVPLISRKLI
jgi:inner membrane protein